MSQAKSAFRLGLPQAIRSIRQRQHLNTTEFARVLGVTQGQVSRYESGKAIPGAVPLGRLLYWAEGIEKNLILDHLADRLGNPAERPTAEEALAEVERLIGHPLSKGPTVGPRSPDPSIWDEFRAATPNLADLLKDVDELCTRRREVGSSLARFVRLWLENKDTDPAVHQCFADAAKYLEFLLKTRVEFEEPDLSGEHVDTENTRRKLA